MEEQTKQRTHGVGYRWDNFDEHITIMLSHDNLGCGLGIYRGPRHNYWFFSITDWGKARDIGEALAEGYHCTRTSSNDG